MRHPKIQWPKNLVHHHFPIKTAMTWWLDLLGGYSLTSATTATTASTKHTRFSDLTMTSLASSICSHPGTLVHDPGMMNRGSSLENGVHRVHHRPSKGNFDGEHDDKLTINQGWEYFIFRQTLLRSIRSHALMVHLCQLGYSLCLCGTL